MAEEEKLNPYEQKIEDDKKEMKEIETETDNWLKTNEKVKDYLSEFKENDVTYFIQSYPRMKASFMHYGKVLGDLPEKHQIGYVEEAQNRLLDIQRKKLFDMICQWDAELIKFDDIECSYDFEQWEGCIDKCPYITPITDEEFELYMKYVNTADFERNSYNMITSYDACRYYYQDTKYDETPAWYIFENTHTGNDKYLVLPMIRSNKEDVYRELWKAERDKETEAKYESGEYKRYVEDTRKPLSNLHYSHVEQFIIHNENKEVLELFRKMYAYFPDRLIRDSEEENEKAWLTERVESIMHELSGNTDIIPIEANKDWRQGLIDAYEKYEKEQIIRALHFAYSEYKIRRELNLGSTESGKKNHELAPMVRKQILRGRVLNGEPEDFNF